MGYVVDRFKEMADNAGKIVTVSNNLPKYLNLGLDTVSSNAETNKQVVLAAAIHEGLESDQLDDRIDDYEGDL